MRPIVVALLLSLLPAQPLSAAPPAAGSDAAPAAGSETPAVRLPPIFLHGNALAGTARKVTVAELDTLAPGTTWTIVDPYRRQDARYSGIQLRDLVAALAPAAVRVRMRAVNDYITVFERHEWEKLPILLATHDGDARMSVANKGPARIVYLNTHENELRMQVHAPKWIWQVIDVEFIGP